MEETVITAQEVPARQGDWMQTYTGRKFWPIDPRPEEVHIEDIAHALSLTCRYGGHCKHFYSVAEHSLLVSYQVPDEHALWGLLHDAAEAYISDIIRPAKPYLTNYKCLETNLMTAICERFGLSLVMPESVRWADEAILADELHRVMGKPPEPWGLRYKAIGVNIIGLAPAEAEKRFINRFYDLVPAASISEEIPAVASVAGPEATASTSLLPNSGCGATISPADDADLHNRANLSPECHEAAEGAADA